MASCCVTELFNEIRIVPCNWGDDDDVAKQLPQFWHQLHRMANHARCRQDRALTRLRGVQERHAQRRAFATWRPLGFACVATAFRAWHRTSKRWRKKRRQARTRGLQAFGSARRLAILRRALCRWRACPPARKPVQQLIAAALLSAVRSALLAATRSSSPVERAQGRLAIPRFAYQLAAGPGAATRQITELVMHAYLSSPRRRVESTTPDAPPRVVQPQSWDLLLRMTPEEVDGVAQHAASLISRPILEHIYRRLEKATRRVRRRSRHLCTTADAWWIWCHLVRLGRTQAALRQQQPRTASKK